MSSFSTFWLEPIAREWRGGLKKYLVDQNMTFDAGWWKNRDYMSHLFVNIVVHAPDEVKYFPDGKDVTLQCLEDWLEGVKE